MSTTRAALLGLILAAPAWADPPPAPVVPVARITAPASVPAGTPIEVRSTGSLSVKPLKFKLISPKGVPFEVWVKADNSETMGVVKAEVTLATPGPFKFALVATGTEDNDFDFAEVAVAPAAGPAPVVPVITPPTPPPAPPPAPYVGPINAVLVYDALAPADTSATLRNKGTVADLAARGADFFIFEKRDANAAPYLVRAAADGLTLPAVYLLDPAGKVLGKFAAPATAAEIVTAIKKIRGAF